jgi:hypothetical protein
MKVVLISLSISLFATTGLLASDIHQSRVGTPSTTSRGLASRGPTVAHGSVYGGYRFEGLQTDRGPLVIAPRWRQNQGELTPDSANSAASSRTQDPGVRSNDSSLSLPSQSLSAPQRTVPKAINLPSGVKPQVTTPAERSQAAANINQKFQEAENKITNQPWNQPNRRNRLEQSRVCFIGLIDCGYPLSLLDLWCNDLLADQVDAGMPIDLIDSYWGQPVSTQDYVEYYNPYEVCTYQTPDGNYLQVTFENGVVAQPM